MVDVTLFLSLVPSILSIKALCMPKMKGVNLHTSLKEKNILKNSKKFTKY